MNYLTHLYLSEPDPLARLGNLAGDFVKGPLTGRYPAAFERGLLLHRRIDLFAHHHLACRRSRARLDPSLRLCRGVLVDIFYDHFLARSWDDYASLPLATFAQSVYADLQRCAPLLPEGLRRIAPRMIADDWLLSYRERATVALVLQRMAQRRPVLAPLARGMAEFETHEAGLLDDFRVFIADLRAWGTASGVEIVWKKGG